MTFQDTDGSIFFNIRSLSTPLPVYLYTTVHTNGYTDIHRPTDKGTYSLSTTRLLMGRTYESCHTG